MILVPLPCACASLRRACRAVTQRYDRELRSTGLRATQFTLLQALSMVGEMSQATLAAVLVLDSTTLTRTLATMSRNGWVSVKQGRDRRQRMVKITDEGRDQLAAAKAGWERAQSRLRTAIGPRDWDELMRLLTRVAAIAQEEGL
ncbi:MAG: MarR family winged helix-turn-helix transcriptional regulator [Egibacteraceae bacterium]